MGEETRGRVRSRSTLVCFAGLEIWSLEGLMTSQRERTNHFCLVQVGNPKASNPLEGPLGRFVQRPIPEAPGRG